MKQAAVILSDYDPDWVFRFDTERRWLESVIGRYLHGTVEHVGSTAVPGLVAKPVIDIMFGVRSLETARAAIGTLTANGYCYFPYKPDVMHWFCKPSAEHRTHHLHLVPYESELWQERIAFRDRLRSDPMVARQYAELKRALAARFREDREAYTEAKWPFIRGVLYGQ